MRSGSLGDWHMPGVPVEADSPSPFPSFSPPPEFEPEGAEAASRETPLPDDDEESMLFDCHHEMARDIRSEIPA